MQESRDSPNRTKNGDTKNGTKYKEQEIYPERPQTIPFIEEPLVFEDASEQVKIGFDTLDVDNIESYTSFSYTFSITIQNRLDKLESDLVIFQTGTSTVDKNLVLGILKTKHFHLTFINHKRKPETVYSQLALKTNKTYDVAVVFNFEFGSTDIALYVNGQVEGMMSMGAKLHGLEGSAYFGSDTNINSFHGVINDPMIHFKALNNVEVREFSSTNKSPTSTSLYQQWRDKKEYENYTSTYSKHKKLPINLVRSFPVNQESYATIKQAHAELQQSRQSMNQSGGQGHEEQEDEEEELTHESILQKQTETLKEYLLSNELLYTKCREFSFNYEWVLVTLQLLSPHIDEKGMTPKLNFKCLHSAICEGSYDPKFYPCYPVELDKFMMVISHVDAKLTKEEVLTIAQVIDCLDNVPKFGPIVLYEKLVLAIRNSCLSTDEIKELIKNDAEEELDEVEHQEEEKKQRGTLSYRKVCFDESNGPEANFDSVPIIEHNHNFSPKNIEIYADKQSHKIVAISIEYVDTAVFEVTSQKFEAQKGFDPEACDHYTVVCEPDEDINQVSAGTAKVENDEFISFLEFRTTKERVVTVGKELVEKEHLHTYRAEDQEQLKGFFGVMTDSLHTLGVVVWEPSTDKSEDALEEEKVDITIIPDVPGTWNMGRFQVVINHWTNWPRAQSTVGLQEADFVQKFNEIGHLLKDIFPNVELIGNYDKPKLFGIFEMYVRGLGPLNEQDEEGRFFLFKNYAGGSNERFPRFARIFDTLCLLAMNYGDSMEMEKAQELYFKRYANKIPPKYKECHDFPANVPDKVAPATKKKN